MGLFYFVSLLMCLMAVALLCLLKKVVVEDDHGRLARFALSMNYLSATVWCFFHTINFSFDPGYEWYVHWIHRVLLLVQVIFLVRYRKKLRDQLVAILWTAEQEALLREPED